ncbi:hypothetical protein QQ045_020101 [Rhodiola kirilowii]
MTGIRLQRNELATSDFKDPQISIYNYPRVGGSKIKRRVLDSREFKKATHYIFSNMPELEQYLQIKLYLHFHVHTKYYVQVWELGETLALPQWIHYLSAGFQSDVACSATYKVNNYKFHIESHGEGRNTVNSHVYVKGTQGTHYYEVIAEIIHMRCRTNHRLKVVLFKCRWYDPQFVRSYPSNGIVILNTHRPYPRYDPYIFAQQAVQVYYVTFPGLAGKNNQGWVAICPVKPTNTIDMEVANVPFQDDGQMGTELPVLVNVTRLYGNLADDELIVLRYNVGLNVTLLLSQNMQHQPSTWDTSQNQDVYRPSISLHEPTTARQGGGDKQQADDYDSDDLLNLVAESTRNKEVDEGAEERDSPSTYDEDHDDTILPEFVRRGTSAGGGLGEVTPLGSMPHDDRPWITPARDDDFDPLQLLTKLDFNVLDLVLRACTAGIRSTPTKLRPTLGRRRLRYYKIPGEASDPGSLKAQNG